MEFLFRKKKKERAGLFVDRDSFQYISLIGDEGHLEVVNSVAAKLPEYMDTERGDDWDIAEASREKIFRNIAGAIGDIKIPVSLAIPPIDSLLRIVPLPDMPLNEAKMAFRYDYERYFPFPVDEAVFDIAPIVYPLQGGEEEKRFIVASTRKSLVTEIMNAASSQGIDVDCIEPAQIALERAVTPKIPYCDAAVYVYAGKKNSVILLSWKGSGIFYRSISDGMENAPSFEYEDTSDDKPEYGFVKEVRSSLQFALSQIRGFEPAEMYLFGPGANDRLSGYMKEMIDIPSVVVTDPVKIHGIEFSGSDDKSQTGWDIPIGLAMRH
jgi:type IV pilus assembly protein PilM